MRGGGKFLIGLALFCVALAIGGFLLLQRADIPYDALQARYANAASRFSVLPGGAVAHFRDEGFQEGRTLLLVHGYGGSLHTWEPWVAALGGKYRIVSIDLPGHGLTQAPKFTPTIENFADFLEAFAAFENLGRVTAAGAGLGGAVAAAWAEHHPERVDALVLIAPAGAAAPPESLTWLGQSWLEPFLRRLDPYPTAFYALHAGLAAHPGAKLMAARYAVLARAPGHRAILLRAARLRGMLPPLRPPSLILQGAADPYVPLAAAERLASANPSARLIVYDGVGHFPQEEAAPRSAADVDSFLTALLAFKASPP
ncbi:MAG: alpha/beta fold hydrolase [Hyphomonadaceae bacterium]